MRVEGSSRRRRLRLGLHLARGYPLLLPERLLGGSTERKQDERTAGDGHKTGLSQAAPLSRWACVAVKVYCKSIHRLLLPLSTWFYQQLIAVVLSFFLGGVLPGFRKPLQQLGNLTSVIGPAQGKYQMIQSRLVCRAVLQNSPAFFDRQLGLPSLQVKFPQDVMSSEERTLQGHGLFC